MARIHPCVEGVPRGMGRAISPFPTIRSGLKFLPNVRAHVPPSSPQVTPTKRPLDSFKDETNITASEYYVVPITEKVSLSRSSSEGRSTPSSSMDATGPGLNSTTSLHLAESRTGSQSASANSPPASNTTVGQPRLGNVTEAYLLRHFQRHLAPWVSSAQALSSSCCRFRFTEYLARRR